jgi:hypothetical protein
LANEENPFQSVKNVNNQSNLPNTSNNLAIIERAHQVNVDNKPNENNTKENFIEKRTIFLLSSFVVALLVLIAGIFIGIFGAFG